MLSNLFIYGLLFLSLYFEVFLLITYFERRKTMGQESAVLPSEDQYPSVTIIVPCFNEEKTVSKTIDSILNLDYPKHLLRVVVVDDGSRDNTFATVQKHFGQNEQVVTYRKANGGKHSALNFALARIDSELVGCLDADSFVESQALKKMLPYFSDPETMVVVPSIRVHEPKNTIQLMQKVEYSWGIFLRKILSYLNALYVTPGPFSIFRRSVFKELGGYRQAHNTEDMEIALRLQSHHYKIANCHEAHVFTVTPPSLKTLYRQRLRWTYGFLKNALDYKHLFFRPQYGNFGVFILPFATLNIFSGLYFTSSLLWRGATKILEQYTKIQAIGVDLAWHSVGFDWFYLNTTAALMIAILLIAISFGIIMISRHLTKEEKYLSMDIVYFLLFYSFIAPFWIIKAIYNTARSRQESWR